MRGELETIIGHWCRRGESNPRPRDYETLALPLSYAGTGGLAMLKASSAKCQGILGSPRIHSAKVFPVAYLRFQQPQLFHTGTTFNPTFWKPSRTNSTS